MDRAQTRYKWLDVHARAALNHDRQAQEELAGFHCYKPVNLQRQRAGSNLTAFAFVGLTEEMDRSVCLLSYYVQGTLPTRCRCGDAGGNAGGVVGMRTSGGATATSGAGTSSATMGGSTTKKPRFQAIHETHGVGRHKGTSAVERRLILALVQEDILLYETAKTMFQRSLAEVQAATHTTVCR